MNTDQQPRAGAQTIYDPLGNVIFLGQWDPRTLLNTISCPDATYWQGKRVLDIGANTFGLSVEIARNGAKVVGIEPDPFDWYFKLIEDTIQKIIKEEDLALDIYRAGLFEAHRFGAFDCVLLLGVIYHFRDPQYLLDFLSTLDVVDVIVSTQTAPGTDLTLHNRCNPGTMPDGFWAEDAILSGWHPTHTLFGKMLEWAGFAEVTPLTDPMVNFPKKPAPGLTNSAYYRATKERRIDPNESRKVYQPR